MIKKSTNIREPIFGQRIKVLISTDIRKDVSEEYTNPPPSQNESNIGLWLTDRSGPEGRNR